jgi:hypothetical protein
MNHHGPASQRGWLGQPLRRCPLKDAEAFLGSWLNILALFHGQLGNRRGNISGSCGGCSDV